MVSHHFFTSIFVSRHFTRTALWTSEWEGGRKDISQGKENLRPPIIYRKTNKQPMQSKEDKTFLKMGSIPCLQKYDHCDSHRKKPYPITSGSINDQIWKATRKAQALAGNEPRRLLCCPPNTGQISSASTPALQMDHVQIRQGVEPLAARAAYAPEGGSPPPARWPSRLGPRRRQPNRRCRPVRRGTACRGTAAAWSRARPPASRPLRPPTKAMEDFPRWAGDPVGLGPAPMAPAFSRRNYAFRQCRTPFCRPPPPSPFCRSLSGPGGDPPPLFFVEIIPN